jgi:hypothetical protein
LSGRLYRVDCCRLARLEPIVQTEPLRGSYTAFPCRASPHSYIVCSTPECGNLWISEFFRGAVATSLWLRTFSSDRSHIAGLGCWATTSVVTAPNGGNDPLSHAPLHYGAWFHYCSQDFRSD